MNQTRLRERCENFIDKTGIPVGKFCELIDVSREFYYSWKNMSYDAGRETTRRIDGFLNSGEAKKMLQDASEYVIYNQRLAGYLMMHGFVLLGLAPRPNGKNLFMFNDTDALHDVIDKWQIERLNKSNQ